MPGRKRFALLRFLGLVAAAACAALWVWFSRPQQSSVRLGSKLSLKELRAAIASFKCSHDKLPEDLKVLRDSGYISDTWRFNEFSYVGGREGVLAFRRKPFRQVKHGEPWGGHGQVAKYDVPEARLVLLEDGSIEFVMESDFAKTFQKLLASPRKGLP